MLRVKESALLSAETIAEAFVRIKNNEAVSDDVKELVRIYVERWRK